eukprot:6195370-Pleurochrysis_carterae.AAC.2
MAMSILMYRLRVHVYASSPMMFYRLIYLAILVANWLAESPPGVAVPTRPSPGKVIATASEPETLCRGAGEGMRDH